MSRWLEGKVALITGGAGEICNAIVECYVLEEARLAVFDLSKERLQGRTPLRIAMSPEDHLGAYVLL